MIIIKAREKALSFDGDSETAIALVNSLRETYYEMPKILSDFCFNIEVALQDAGVMDQDFNIIKA